MPDQARHDSLFSVIAGLTRNPDSGEFERGGRFAVDAGSSPA